MKSQGSSSAEYSLAVVGDGSGGIRERVGPGPAWG
jgi:hypothetical protein